MNTEPGNVYQRDVIRRNLSLRKRTIEEIEDEVRRTGKTTVLDDSKRRLLPANGVEVGLAKTQPGDVVGGTAIVLAFVFFPN